MKVAVVGGTGTIGRAVVEELIGRGHEVRVLSRKPPVRGGGAFFPVDLTTGEGLDPALAGVEVVVDASNPRAARGAPKGAPAEAVMVDGSQRLLAAEKQAGVVHHVLISIVGIEVGALEYQRLKLRQEATVIGGPVPWTIVRATQFPELLDYLFATTSRRGFLPGLEVPLQPVDTREVAPVIATAVEKAEGGSRLEIVGPELSTIASLARIWRRARGKRSIVLPIPLFGRRGRALKAGALTSLTAPKGSITFEDWLEERPRAVDPKGG